MHKHCQQLPLNFFFPFDLLKHLLIWIMVVSFFHLLKLSIWIWSLVYAQPVTAPLFQYLSFLP